jgi:hypothetical protein
MPITAPQLFIDLNHTALKSYAGAPPSSPKFNAALNVAMYLQPYYGGVYVVGNTPPLWTAIYNSCIAAGCTVAEAKAMATAALAAFLAAKQAGKSLQDCELAAIAAAWVAAVSLNGGDPATLGWEMAAYQQCVFEWAFFHANPASPASALPAVQDAVLFFSLV